jgi:hypothetical protein
MTENHDTSINQGGCLSMLGWVLGLNVIWLLMAVLAVYLGMRSYRLSVNGEVVTGTVVRLVEDDREGSSSFNDIFPVVEFEVDGQTYSVRSQNNYRWWNQYTRFGIGKQVEMRYDPADPASAEINSWADLWGEPIILGVFTLAAVIVTNGFFILRWRAGRATQTPS